MYQTAFTDTTGQGHASATLRVPQDADATRTAHPLIVLLAGRGNTGDQMRTTTFPILVNLENDSKAFVLPLTGKTSSQGTGSWNGSTSCCWPTGADGAGPDDSTYINTMITNVKTAWNHARSDGGSMIDPKRVYILAHSAGSYMAYRFACDHADVVAAVWQQAGAALDTGDPACSPSENVSIVHAHGTSDGSTYAGNVTITGQASAVSDVEADQTWADATMHQINTFNSCSTYPGSLSLTTSSYGDFDTAVVGSETDLYDLAGCPTNGKGRLYKMNGSVHVPTTNVAWENEIIAWFNAHPKP